MDKKILIALGLISASSIDNASGMNGIIENPSVNESQSMKTINDFSYDLRSLGPVNRLFNCSNYFDMKNWRTVLCDVAPVVEMYWNTPDAHMMECIYAFNVLIAQHKLACEFVNSHESDDKSIDILTKLFVLAPRSLGEKVYTSAYFSYSKFIFNLGKYGFVKAIQQEVDNKWNANISPVAQEIAYNVYEK